MSVLLAHPNKCNTQQSTATTAATYNETNAVTVTRLPQRRSLTGDPMKYGTTNNVCAKSCTRVDWNMSWPLLCACSQSRKQEGLQCFGNQRQVLDRSKHLTVLHVKKRRSPLPMSSATHAHTATVSSMCPTNGRLTWWCLAPSAMHHLLPTLATRHIDRTVCSPSTNGWFN
jgi:hypothetical protein